MKYVYVLMLNLFLLKSSYISWMLIVSACIFLTFERREILDQSNFDAWLFKSKQTCGRSVTSCVFFKLWNYNESMQLNDQLITIKFAQFLF